MPPFLSYTASHRPGDATTSLPNVRNSWALVNTAPRSPLGHNVSYEQGHTHPNVSQLLFWPRPHAGSRLLASRRCGLSSLEFLGVPTPACALPLAAGPHAAGPHALFLRVVREGPWRVCSPTSSTRCVCVQSPRRPQLPQSSEGGRQPPSPRCCQCCCPRTGMRRCPLVPLGPLQAGAPLLAPQVPRPTVHASPCQSLPWTVEMPLHSGNSRVGASSVFQNAFFLEGDDSLLFSLQSSKNFLVRC